MLHMLPLSLLLALPLSSVWAAPMCSLRSAVSSASQSAISPSATPAVQGATTPGPSPAASPANGGNGTNNRFVSTAWYTGWNADAFPLQQISWSKYTSMTYAFALTTNDPTNVLLQPSDQQLLPQFVDLAHQNNVSALLTIGGWTGSQYFSTAVGSAENRTAFVQTVLGLVSQYKLDGLDFDWEYPNGAGVACNVVSPQDAANFLSFLQALRAAPGGSNLILSAAVSLKPFAGPDGSPMTDVSAFAKVLNHVAIMNYDVWGSWSNAVGPNAPLNDTCASGAQQQGSAVSAVKAWTGAGFPANQLVLGVAAYGHSFDVANSAAFATSSSDSTSPQPAGTRALAAYPAFNKAQQPQGDSSDVASSPGVDQCGSPTSGGFSGIFNFWGLIESGLLDANGTAKSGMGFRFDECSQTPYVYDPANGTMVSYDDAQSFAAKGNFIRDAGLGGFSMWEAAGDSHDILLDAIRGGLSASS